MKNIRVKVREALLADELNVVNGITGQPIEVNPYLKEALRNRLADAFKLNDKVTINSKTTDVKEGKVIGTDHPFVYVLSEQGQHLLYEHELTVVGKVDTED